MVHRLLELEEQGWQALSSPDPVPFCEEWLADDALVIVPGMVVDRATFLQAVAHEEPWASHRIEERRTIELTDNSAALVYRGDGQGEMVNPNSRLADECLRGAGRSLAARPAPADADAPGAVAARAPTGTESAR
jgi:hypothetical protein